MDETRGILCHFLAALAYRTQKALRDAPADFGAFRAADGVRTPSELVRHMASVLGHARTYFVGGTYHPEPLASLRDEVLRFHEMLSALAAHLEKGTALREGMTPERLLQGPLSDAMTHAGQLAKLRRFAGSPVPPENFVHAAIDPQRLGPDQADPVGPDAVWPEAPPKWKPRPSFVGRPAQSRSTRTRRKDPMGKSDTLVGIAWYRPDQWSRLLRLSIDGDELEASYEEWVAEAQQTMAQMTAAGMSARRVDIDLDDLLRWCRDNARPLDAKARSAYTVDRLQSESQGGRSEDV